MPDVHPRVLRLFCATDAIVAGKNYYRKNYQRDNLRFIDTLKNLRDMGNTVLVVEHDAEMMMSCDHIVDMGPGAGVHGGEVVFQGTPEEILINDKSITGRVFLGEEI